MLASSYYYFEEEVAVVVVVRTFQLIDHPGEEEEEVGRTFPVEVVHHTFPFPPVVVVEVAYYYCPSSYRP